MKFRPTKTSFNEALLIDAPAQGVDRIISEVRTRMNEEENKMFMEACVKYNVDPDALLKTARLNSELQAELRRATDALPQWISVEERYPETKGMYLTCDHKGNIHVFLYYPGQVYPFTIRDNDRSYYPPTHWMYLPEPPKEKEIDNGT